NVAGITLLYGLPFARDLPIIAAEKLADVAVARRSIAVGYVTVGFVILPLIGVALFR
ncbi:MAG: sodium dependent phosphate transporter, partial [Actinomycetia bacterium]|nr:sodium dependent phosphate transporter [Actinomycetes bacterium]